MNETKKQQVETEAKPQTKSSTQSKETISSKSSIEKPKSRKEKQAKLRKVATEIERQLRVKIVPLELDLEEVVRYKNIIGGAVDVTDEHIAGRMDAIVEKYDLK